MPRVTVIPASRNPFSHKPSHVVQKRRVAGYARVSTDSNEQFTSYEAQVDYYTEYIKKRNDWEFVAVYYGIPQTSIVRSFGNAIINGRKMCVVGRRR